jgi:hypothetical protein
MGRRNFNGTVSIGNDKNTIRLRWRFASKRYSLNVFEYSKQNLLKAKKVALAIEDDIVWNAFDESLDCYKLLVTQSVLQHSTKAGADQDSINKSSAKGSSIGHVLPISISDYFNRYIAAKSMDPHSEDLSSYYTQTRTMIKKWGTLIQPMHLFFFVKNSLDQRHLMTDALPNQIFWLDGPERQALGQSSVGSHFTTSILHSF